MQSSIIEFIPISYHYILTYHKRLICESFKSGVDHARRTVRVIAHTPLEGDAPQKCTVPDVFTMVPVSNVIYNYKIVVLIWKHEWKRPCPPVEGQLGWRGHTHKPSTSLRRDDGQLACPFHQGRHIGVNYCRSFSSPLRSEAFIMH
jgi:hypothetical protein